MDSLEEAIQHILNGLKFPDSKDHARVYVCAEKALKCLSRHKAHFDFLKGIADNFPHVTKCGHCGKHTRNPVNVWQPLTYEEIKRD